MKKINVISLLLSMVLLLQCSVFPAAATETSAAVTEGGVPPLETAVTEPTQPAFGTLCITNGCRTIDGMVPLAGSDRRLDTAQAVFLYETNTKTVIYSYNPDIRLAPGSLVKIVTAIVAIEYCNLDDTVTVVEGIKGRLPVSPLDIDLTSNEEVKVRDLLYALLLVSANDAAVALAEHVAGNRQAYVALMNQWVKSIGCTDTEFSTVHGVDGGLSHTSARDMARIIMVCMKNETFCEIFGAPNHEIPPTNKSDARKFSTTNYLIDQAIVPDFYDNRVTGGIQSYENSSGACLAVTAEYKGMNFIGVVLGGTRTFAENGWSVKSYGNFNEMTELLRFGFDNFKINRILYEGMSLTQFSVAGGESTAVGMAMVNYDTVVPTTVRMENLIMDFTVVDGGLTAPIQEGQLIATVAVKYRNSVVAEAEVYAMGNVKSANNTGVTIRSVAARTDSDDSGILSVIGTICVIVLGLAAGYLAFNAYMRSRIRARRRRRRAARRRNR